MGYMRDMGSIMSGGVWNCNWEGMVTYAADIFT